MSVQPQLPDVEQRPAQSGPQPQPKVVAVQPPRRSRRPLIILLLLLALGTAGYFVWKRFFAVPPVPDSLVVLSGRIEGDDSAVSPKTTGRILDVRFREGDSVKAGDIMATLDDQQVRAREEQATAALQQAVARSKSAQDQISVLEEQLRQGEDEVAQQDASYKLALWDEEAYTRLAKSGAVSERQGKQAQSTAEQQRAALAAARRRVAAIQMQIAQQHSEIASANASTQQARAQLAEAQANRQDLIVRAPFSGTVATRTAEPGEVVTAGTAIITLVDLNLVYLRGFVPEGQIGKIKLGQPAHVFLDSNPNQAIDAQVSRIDPKATFTPENTYFRDDRVKQVVGLKLQLKAGFGYAKPGMPADGEILVSGDHWPEGRWRK
ncbi:MAG TPA: HlyD family efflux transporter periplasmic adaptor subunit [Candidatus Angelobacter sp.]